MNQGSRSPSGRLTGICFRTSSKTHSGCFTVYSNLRAGGFYSESYGLHGHFHKACPVVVVLP